MDFYQANLAAFVAINAYLLYCQYHRGNEESGFDVADPPNLESLEKLPDAGAVQLFQITFFLPYALAGPHIYAIYKYEKNIPEKIVAALYAVGFVSGGISASLAGELADKHGRKKACMLYCGLYALTCLTMLRDKLIILFFGRVCGGIATTLLFSVFEAWMISDYRDRGLNRFGLELSSVFGNMTTVSCIVAIISGVVGDLLVTYSGTRTWPFLAAVPCCIGAALLMSKSWKENYGIRSVEQSSIEDIKGAAKVILKNPQMLSLSIASCVFEGTMYLFIFFWSATLESVRLQSGSSIELPFGVIFSSFMCAMMAGSAVFSLQKSAPSTRTSSGMLMSVILIVSCCLSLIVLLQNEYLIFWVLCLLEGCVGVYFPSMAYLKSEMIEDGVRGRVYSILRFPLNCFVVIAHSLDEEGDDHRKHVFLVCAMLLLFAFILARRYSPN